MLRLTYGQHIVNVMIDEFNIQILVCSDDYPASYGM